MISKSHDKSENHQSIWEEKNHILEHQQKIERNKEKGKKICKIIYKFPSTK